jgi:hypothetical protein
MAPAPRRARERRATALRRQTLARAARRRQNTVVSTPPIAAPAPQPNAVQPRCGAQLAFRAALAAAVALLLAAVLPLPHPAFLGFQPTPDAPEYLAGAVALLQHGANTIELAGERHPSRYPPGYSAAIAAWIALGVPPLRAPFVASAAAALALLLLVAAAARRAGGDAAAAVAVVVLAATPGFLTLARAPMAETTSVVLTTAGGVAAAAWLRSRRPGVALAAGALLGAATIVRVANVLLWPLAAAAWLAARRSDRARGREAAALALGLALGCAPLLLYQWLTFGHPLANGYAYWVPGHDTFTSSFGLEHVRANAIYLAREALQCEWRATAASFHGSGDHVGPAGLVLLAWATLRALRDRSSRWLVLGLSPFALLMAGYFFQDARFLAPLVPFAAIGVGVAVPAVWAGARTWVRAVLLVLLALHVANVPGSGAPSSLALLRPPAAAAPSHDALSRLRAEPAGTALVTCDPVHARVGLGEGWIAAPANDDHDYRWNPARFRFGGAERDALVARTLAAGRPVYLLAPADLTGAIAARPAPAGTRWVEQWRLPGGGGAARLTPF